MWFTPTHAVLVVSATVTKRMGGGGVEVKVRGTKSLG